MKAKAPHKPGRPAPSRKVSFASVAQQPSTLRRLEPWLYLLGLAVAGFAIYGRSLYGPFLFDDADLLEVRSAVRIKNLYIILSGPRPLTILSFALNHALAGVDPFYFHLVNVVLHILNAAILWRIVRLLSPPAPIAYLAPLLFLASPVQTESVAYISSRSEVLAAAFYLLALWAFLAPWRDRRPWANAGLVAVLFGCSVSSKQHGVTLPVAILLVDYFFLAHCDWRQLKKNWRAYAVLGVEMAAGGFIVVRNIINVPSAGFFLKDVTWKSYLLTQFRMYFLYLRLLLFPVGLNADYDIQPSRSLLEQGSWLALAGLLLLVGAAVYLRRRLALVSFGVLFFFLALLPTSSFYPLLDYAAERRVYLSSIGFFLAVLALAWEWRPARQSLVRACGAVLILYAAGTYSRCRLWQDPLALWLDTVEKSPRKWRGYTWLGLEYQKRGRFTEAGAAFQKAAELVPPNTPEQAEIFSSLGSTFNNRKMYDEAIPYYQAALQIRPAGTSTVWTNLGLAEIRVGRAEGWNDLQKAIRVNPLAWEPHFARGNLYFEMGRYEDAIRDYRRVLNLVPDLADAQNNLRAAEAAAALTRQALPQSGKK